MGRAAFGFLRSICIALLFCSVTGCLFGDSEPGPAEQQKPEDPYEVSLRGSILGSVSEKDVSDALPDRLPAELRDDFLRRGKYLVRGAACGSCHGKSAGDPDSVLSGGRVIRDRFGEVRAANLTPIEQGGLGSWTLREIGSALRSSLGKDERPLSLDVHAQYRWLSDPDTLAIAAYLKSLPPVRNDFDRRELGTFERSSMGIVSRHQPIFGYVPSPGTNSPREYGRYLVHNVANCVSCHTPEGGMFSDGELFAGREPSDDPDAFPKGGGDIRGKSAKGLKSWQAADIVSYLSTGITLKNRKVDGRLCPWPYFKDLTAKDKQAIAEYLKGVSG